MARLGAVLLGAPLALATLAVAAESPTGKALDFFETKIRPVLATTCYTCHSAEAKTRMGGLSLDTRNGIREGGLRGHAVVPGDVEASIILQALRYDGALKMPPTGKLPDEVIENFAKWVKMGAPDPREVRIQQAASTIDVERGRQYWAFNPPRKTALPVVKEASWPSGVIDQYVLSGMEERSLRPVPDADKTDLLRRLTFDLTGLPPTPEEIEAFLKDKDESAYRRVVDRLLESERFGERWGRHWLDIVRYADTIGRTRNFPFPVAWRYRDYVIESFNEDKPYDLFLREQIAGDLLPFESSEHRIENQIATGFLALGANDLNEPDAKQFDMDVADEMINVSTRSMLALSVGCARCHDHKFDPIPTKDYYALATIFRSTELRNGLKRRPQFGAGYFSPDRLVALDGVPDFSSADGTAIRAERERLWTELQAAQKDRDRAKTRAVMKELSKLPLPENLAIGVLETGKTAALKVNIGGDPHTLGEPVEAGFVQVLFPADAKLPRIRKGDSGRLQLAEWLTHRDNPLTARVMANRTWHHLFGKGLVATVDNFGSTGRQPTNRPLLDYLAVQFMDQGWSVKSLIREIVSSRAYRLSTDLDKNNFESDPDNDYLWRANLRRLEAESLRDSVLLVSGELQAGPPPPSPINDVDPNQQIRTGGKGLKSWELEESYRSVFVPVIRNQANRLFEIFDFPEPSETHGARDVTIGPSQALFMMNNGFVRSHAVTAAERLLASRSNDKARVRQVFRQVLSRDPTADEAKGAVSHVQATLERLDSEPRPETLVAAEQDWLRGLLAVALDREPHGDEMAAATETVETVRRRAVRGPNAGEGDPKTIAAQRVVTKFLGRAPNREERTKVSKYLRQSQASQRRGSGPDAGDRLFAVASANPENEAWSRLYHALFNSAEFRYRN